MGELLMDSVISIPVTASPTDALTKLQQSQAPFAVLLDANLPQALVQRKYLEELSRTEERRLSEIIGQLPPVMIMDESIRSIEGDSLKDMALLLEEECLPGIVVYQDQYIVGVVSLQALVAAIPDSEVVESGQKGLYGPPSMALRRYICPKCKMERQAKFVYSTYDVGPDCVCPFNKDHGKLETYQRE